MLLSRLWMLHRIPLIHGPERERGDDANTSGAEDCTDERADSGPRGGLAEDVTGAPTDHSAKNASQHDGGEAKPAGLSRRRGANGLRCRQGFEWHPWGGQFATVR